MQVVGTWRPNFLWHPGIIRARHGQEKTPGVVQSEYNVWGRPYMIGLRFCDMFTAMWRFCGAA